jgi:hypothetical protein
MRSFPIHTVATEKGTQETVKHENQKQHENDGREHTKNAMVQSALLRDDQGFPSAIDLRKAAFVPNAPF